MMFIQLIFISFCSTVLSLNLECKHRNHGWGYVGYINDCYATNAVFTSIDSEITSVDNKHESTTMLGLDFDSQTVHYLPKGLTRFFLDLQVLQICKSKLKTIQKDDLEPFKSLKFLKLDHNQLESLESDLLEFNTKLEFIDFGNNQIETLERDLFEFNTKLQWICLSGNPLKHVEKNLLMPVRKLEYVNFSDCNCVSKTATSSEEQELLISMLQSQCTYSLEMKKRKYCRHDIDELNNEITGLTNELQNQKQKVVDLEGKLKASSVNSIALNGNLDTATRQLFMASEQLESYNKFVSSWITDQKLVLSCKNYASSELCEAVDFKVESSNTQLIRIEDENGTSIGSNVKSLTIVNQQTFFLPTNLVEHLPAIEDLIVDSSGFYEITSSTFGEMTTLTSLSLPRNKLYVIQTDAFKDLMNLKELDLSQNKLTTLETGAFNGLEKLEKITLNDNSLTVARSEVFGTLKSLKNLLFGDNELIAIGADLLSTLTNIESAEFTNNLCINMSLPTNTIRQIEALINENCISPIKLFCDTQETLSSCKAVNMNVIDPMTKVSKVVGIKAAVNESLVTTFIVVNQSIKFMPHQLAQVFPNLESIKVDNSDLKSLQKSDFQGMSKLKTIVICNNSLSVIREGTFDEVQQIEHLDLSRNQIVSLELKVFFHLVHLKNLILTGNKLTMLKADLIPPTNAIKILKLDGNNLNSIESRFLRYLRNANTIDLRANKCIDLLYEAMVAADQRAFRNFYNDVEFECSSET